MSSAMPTAPVRATRRPLIGMLAGNAISMIGSMMTFIAIPWFVLQTTGSPAKTGIVTAVAILPMILGGAIGGALVDRLGFRRMSITADVASGVAVMLIPALHHTGGLAFWQLLVLVFLRGLLDSPGNTARVSLLPDLADLAGVARERANALAQANIRGATLLGPPIAGALIGFIGASHVLWVDAASFFVSAAMVSATVPRQRSSGEATAGGPTRYLEDLRSGLRFIRGDRLLLALALNNAASNACDGLLTVGAPVYAKTYLGQAVDLGLMFSGLGAGALASLVLYARFGTRLPRRATYAIGLAGVGVGFGALVFAPERMLAIAAFVVAGLAAGPINPVQMTVLQERTPTDLRGRVFGLLSALAMSAMPLGRLAAGYVIEEIGLLTALGIAAGGYLLTALVAAVLPAFRGMDSSPQRNTHQ